MLDLLGLGDLDAIATYGGGELIVSGGHRKVRRLETDSGRFFLKQSFRGGALLGRLRSGSPFRSSSRREAENFVVLGELGIGCPDVLAWGEARVGLSEGFSFLLTRAAAGLDLPEWLATSPEPTALRAVAGSVAEVVLGLAHAGLCFQDLVPRHVFVAMTDDRPQVELIDLHRLKRCAPIEAAACMCESLDSEMPVRLLSSGRRLAFLRSVEAALPTSISARLVALRNAGAGKRRRARRRMQRSVRMNDGTGTAATEDWLARDQTIFVRSEGRELVAKLEVVLERDLGSVSSLTETERLRARAAAADLGLELIFANHDELREIHHGHQYLSGLVTMPEALARRIDRSAAAFYLRRQATGRSLIESLANPPREDRQIMLGRLSEALAWLSEGSLLPRGRLLDSFLIEAGGALMFSPGATRVGRPLRENLRREIAAELLTLGLAREEVESVLSDLPVDLPGLLGSRRLPGALKLRK